MSYPNRSISVEQATDWINVNSAFIVWDGFVRLGTLSREKMPTTQKVSHPPVRPKYGAFAPARPLLNTVMAQRVVVVVNWEHEEGEKGTDGKEKRKSGIR